MSRARQEVSFQETGDPRDRYEAIVDGERWTVRINEFPEEPSLYSLLVAGEVVEELMDWPSGWSRPAPPTHAVADDPHEHAEYDREQAHFERTRGIPSSRRVK